MRWLPALFAIGLAACAYDFAAVPRVDGGVTLVECNPITGLGCSGGATCSAWVAPGAFDIRCAPRGTVARGGPCAGVGECAPGLMCVQPGGSGSCQEFCTDSRACTGGMTCDRATPLVAVDGQGAFLCR